VFGQVLLGQLEKQAFSSLRYLRPVKPQDARGLVQKTYGQIRRDFGLLVAPMTLHSSVPPLLAAVWTMCRETLFCGRLSQVQREALSAAVSRLNRCPFCVEVHTLSLRALQVPQTAGHRAESDSELEASISEASMHRLGAWVEGVHTSSPSSPDFPFDPAAFAETAALILGFHYTNRMVNIFLPESVLPVSARWPRLHFIVQGLAARVIGHLARRRPEAGLASDLLSSSQVPAGLPAEFGWAAADGRIAQALGRCAAIVENVGKVLPPAARQRVEARLAVWHGEEMPLDRRWLDAVAEGLGPKEGAAARLALLSALAAYRVSPEEVASFRRYYPTDAELLSVSAWGAFAAVRRIASWLKPPRQ
jgi:AhpD family alkylhydroperoxidase